jgi:uncharacterized membrane protein YbhN (UPF0104 family)
VGGAGILAVVVAQLGAGPFLDAVRAIGTGSLAAATVVTAVTTLCCAWRWRVVADRLGLQVPLGPAFAAYYRSQFLNAILPTGVLGDVHRGLDHGRAVGDLGRGMRAVAWERAAGQAVQIVLMLVVLTLRPSPVRSLVPIVAAAGAGALLVVVLASGPMARHSRIVRSVVADLGNLLREGRAWRGIVLTSAVASVGHALLFLVAARAAGTAGSADRILPLALLVLLASALPANIAGWGPREGMAAWAFSAAGLGAAQGVTTAAVYGVMVLVATLPGAGVLVAARRQHSTADLSHLPPADLMSTRD